MVICYACRGAAAAIVVYDITSKHSFQRAKTWVEELRKNASANMVVALAGMFGRYIVVTVSSFVELQKHYADLP